MNTRTKDRLVISPDGEEGMKKRKELFSKVYQEKEEHSTGVRGDREGEETERGACTTLFIILYSNSVLL